MKQIDAIFEKLNAELYDEKPKDDDPDAPCKNNPEFTVAEDKKYKAELVIAIDNWAEAIRENLKKSRDIAQRALNRD